MASRFYRLNPQITRLFPHVTRRRGSDGILFDTDFDGRPSSRAGNGVHILLTDVVEFDDLDRRLNQAILKATIWSGGTAVSLLVETTGPADYVLKDRL